MLQHIPQPRATRLSEKAQRAGLRVSSLVVVALGWELLAHRLDSLLLPGFAESQHPGRVGEMIWFSWQTLRTEELYASLIVIAALGISFNLILQRLTARLVPWQVEREI